MLNTKLNKWTALDYNTLEESRLDALPSFSLSLCHQKYVKKKKIWVQYWRQSTTKKWDWGRRRSVGELLLTSSTSAPPPWHCCHGPAVWWSCVTADPAQAMSHQPGDVVLAAPCSSPRTVRHLWSMSHPSRLLILEPNASIRASWLCCCGQRIALSLGSHLEHFIKGLAWGAGLARSRPGGVLWVEQVRADNGNRGRRRMETLPAAPGLFCRFLLRGRFWASLDDRAPVILKCSVPRINRDKDLRSYFPWCHLRFSSHIWLLHMAENSCYQHQTKTNPKNRSFSFIPDIS